ncbi:hypothetical protein CLV94_1894 [Flavobacterium endophyticum]|uniref:Tetratricopeptide repeat protein n=1 Tax=Flavobacterium endophyticum TaxID=1540163 RepID=A0A495MLJ7_9FLAO|nr:hypothetical protein [Flavobacterium endophyticum]RKS26824.1 hypothetical protein CLV94_1894 [Flavobacterium endophyticum]
MKKYSVGLLLFLSAISYAQNKIEKTTYISNSYGQDIKLNLHENNQYELVVFYGNYEIKNDTLHLNNNHSEGSDFSVAFSSDSNPSLGKVKVNLKGVSSYYSGLHIGTQTGNSEPTYKSISDLGGEMNFDETELNFEINKSDYFYLAKEDYNGETTLYKYALPRGTNKIEIEYNANYLGQIKLQGYLNEKNELVVSEKNKKSPITFVPESRKPKAVESQVKPLETKKEANWTYPGKADLYGLAADTTAMVASDFKLVVQDNLQKALEATKKTPQKFLVVSYEPDDKNAKTAFDAFIQNQQYAIGGYSYEYNADYDKYNYYLATAKDKSWASKNKITDNPSTIIMDADGTILGQIKGSLSKNEPLFSVYYSSIGDQLKLVKAKIDLNKALNSKKTKDSEIVKKMVPLSENNSAWAISPPMVTTAVAVPAEKVVEEEVPVEVAEVAVDTVAAYPAYYDQNEAVYTKVDFDKKKLLAAWSRIVDSHSKDAAPDMDFVKVALAEIQNSGFYYSLFNEGRPFDETNFKAIDYLLKHYDAILQEQKTASGQGEMVDYYGDYASTIETQLPTAISNGISQLSEKTTDEYQNRMMAVYKKTVEKKSDDYNATIEYLRVLQGFAESTNKESQFIEEYDAFYKKTFKGRQNEIEILDEMYSTPGKGYQTYNDWSSFKNSFSNASNEAAWFVVQKAKNPESIKKAIQWSESSLRIEKNNPYYLDTLAQLYYKNGEKQKAIATQEQALKFSQDMGDETKADLQSVLEKMKNGTY